VGEAVVAALAAQGYEPEYGARPLRRVLRRRIENPLATELLEEHFSGASGVRLEVAAAAPGVPAGGFRFLPLPGEGSSVR
jgi:ATP-dependent Clp protease ATP-binding subunit ClpA